MPARTETREGSTDISGRCKESEDNGGRRCARVGEVRAFREAGMRTTFPLFIVSRCLCFTRPGLVFLHTIRLPRVESLREPITWCIIHNACYISPATCASPSLLLADITFAGAPVSFDSPFTARFKNESMHGTAEDVGDKFDLAKLQWNAMAVCYSCTLMDK